MGSSCSPTFWLQTFAWHSIFSNVFIQLHYNPSSQQVHPGVRRCCRTLEVVGRGGVHSARSFGLKLYSFAPSSYKATDWLLPLGPCGTAVAPRLGVQRTGLSKTSVFPKAGLGQFSWSSNTVFSEQGEKQAYQNFSLRAGPIYVLHDGKSK